tara:strand:+ start:123 stop:1154 length:1032 start_codon:yes stop_codon:yes gene_type:complete
MSGRIGPLIIAEAGVNHNGDLGRARDLVRAAADAGADYVKFQGFRAEEIVAPDAATAAYQSENTGKDSQFELLRELELSLDQLATVAGDCRAAGIGFMCTPFDAAMTGPLIEMGMDHIKSPSGELTNAPYLQIIGGFGMPVILSTGMATLDEVRAALETLRSTGAGQVTALHCTSLYPAPIDTVNLKAMATMACALDIPVGYSDHTMGGHVAVAATALGATVIEKHFTLDRSLPGPDHKASLEPDELAAMVAQVRDIAVALGDGVKAPAEHEQDTAELVRRSWHAARDLDAGAVLTKDDVALRRPATGISPDEAVVGRTLARAVAGGAPLIAADLSGNRSIES